MSQPLRTTLLLSVLSSLLLSTGCMATRTTTTSRTAVEQALLSRSVDESISSNDFPAGNGQTFKIDSEGFTATDKILIVSSLRSALLYSGFSEASGEDAKPDLTIYPVVEFSAIDDSDFLIGIPSIPIPVGPQAVIPTPEIALLKKSDQWGRSRIGVTAVDSQTGALVFTTAGQPAQEDYRRWTVLIVITFRKTTLGEPF